MKLYKKIVKGIFIAVTLSVWLYFLYEFFVKEYMKDGVRLIDDSSIFIGIVFTLVLLLVVIYHAKFFNIYQSRKIWIDTTIVDIILIISNFVFSGVVIMFGMGLLISCLGKSDFLVMILLPISILFYSLYSFIEGLKVNQYLKRDLKTETDASIDELGKG